MLEEIKNTESEYDALFDEVTESSENIEIEEIVFEVIKIEESENSGTKLEETADSFEDIEMKIL